MSIKDPLTGALSREKLLTKLRQVHNNTQSAQETYSVLLLIVDGLRTFNDKFGYSVGEAVLRTVSAAIKRSVRKDFIVGRLGKDEFLIVMPQMAKNESVFLAEGIRKTIAHTKISHQDRPLSMHASLGVVNYPEQAQSVEAVLSRAQEAVSISQRANGNKVSTIV